MKTAREIYLIRRPEGTPRETDFAVTNVQVADAGDGEVQIEAIFTSVDPYMRTRLDVDQPLNAPMIGTGLGRVIQSRNERFKEGDIVRHSAGMRELFISSGKNLTLINQDPSLPLSVYMHALGSTGLTAYGGLLNVGALKDGDQVFVSTAAGAVGSVAAQIAKIKGCYVVGSTGSDDKAAWLKNDIKLDAVINYKTEPLLEALTAATPMGIDVYFENVGGKHLDAALSRINERGRIPVCGMISVYNGGGDPVANLFRLIYGRIRMEGFVSTDLAHLRPAFEAEMTEWLKSGLVKYQETIVDGFEHAPAALIGLFEGRNRGKMLVRVSDT